MAKKETPSPFRLPTSPFVSPALRAGDIASRVLNKIFSDRGFTTREIITQWETIVGPDLARVTAPERLRWPRRTSFQDDPNAPGAFDSASLHIRVEGPIAIEVQHLAPQIIERINQFFGYPAIGSIRIVQAPIQDREWERPGETNASHPGGIREDSGNPTSDVSIPGIQDPELSAALARLGSRIKRK